MILNAEELKALPKIKRLNMVNSITGIKPANLIGTIDEIGKTNLAIFSSVVHLGSNPAIIGMILRPNTEVRRHTFENIETTKFYTINHVNKNFVEQAHYTSAKFSKEQSEFKYCNFTEEYLQDFKAPFVKESNIKIGLKFEEAIPIKMNGTILVIGSIQKIILPDEFVNADGQVNLQKAESAGISGLNCYYEFLKIAELPYARVKELPDFG